MGQGVSVLGQQDSPSIDQLNHDLTEAFATKCFSSLELYHFKEVFKTLADSQSGLKYWSEPTLCRFLELPDVLGVGPVINQMATYLGAFPFPSQAPAILTSDALLKVVTLLTGRYTKVLKRGKSQWMRVIYQSLAVYDRKSLHIRDEKDDRPNVDELLSSNKGGETSSSKTAGFSIDQPTGDDEEMEDDDDLTLAALDSLDAIGVFQEAERSDILRSIVPSDNFLKLLELLLLVAPLDAQQDLSIPATELTDQRVTAIRQTAHSILSSFGIDKGPGVSYKTFKKVINTTLPFLFDGLGPLFEHFLFAKDIDLSRRTSAMSNPPSPTTPRTPKMSATPKARPQPIPVLPKEGEILTVPILNQLSFFLKPDRNPLFHRLRPLYSGAEQGFSMGSFEKSVFNWQSPTILLVAGTRLPSNPTGSRERAFADSLPHSRLPSSDASTPTSPASTTHPPAPSDTTPQRLVFGAYIPVPWTHTHKHNFGTRDTLLFQLAPAHDLFRASALATDYIYFSKPPSHPVAGLGFGSATPGSATQQASAATASIASPGSPSAHRRSGSLTGGGSGIFTPGPVSLHLDDALEFGAFTHLASGGGSFGASALRGGDWQDRFEIEAVEVWGVGGEEEMARQKKAWEWEEREARRRRDVNLGKGDVEADRELLKMAGLIGGERSGGSMA
ncbi:MAG: Restriction of telomere capping protein 5 [Bathelium mastoideum]|nr:MAG: Restriction of telomere capping protein 5 [Bathelium mastoideum]